jgi:hypothetical protein
MIGINLLPQELRRKKRTQFEMPQISVLPIVAIVAVALVGIHIVLSLLLGINGGRLKRWNARWDGMGPEREKTEKVTKQIASLKGRVLAIRKIAKPEVDWAEILTGLNQAVTPHVWLSSFDMNFSKGAKKKKVSRRKSKSKKKEKVEVVIPVLYLSGFALGESEVATSSSAKFITSLEETDNFSKYFDKIELKNIRSQKVLKESVMGFELNCKFKGKKVEAEKAAAPSKKKK